MSSFIFVFPGQGAQHVGMLKEFYEYSSTVKETFEEASDALSLDFKKLLFNGTEDELKKTENTQPALLLSGTALSRHILKEYNISPNATAGHSVGEYSSMVLSEVFDFTTGLKAVKFRGQSMQNSVPLGMGGMAALLGFDLEQVKKICDFITKDNSVLEPANVNCPGQIVVSGHQTAIEELSSLDFSKVLEELPRRSKVIPLSVSAPFHCSLMKEAESKMAEFFETVTFNKPKYPIVQNVTAQEETEPSVLKENLIKQVSASVLWSPSFENTSEDNIFIELGPGEVLKGLNKKINKKLKTISINKPEHLSELEGVLV